MAHEILIEYPTHYREMVERLSSFPEYQSKGKFNLYHYIGTKYHLKEMKTPELREIFNKAWTNEGNPMDQQFIDWQYVWEQSAQFEALQMAIYFIIKHRENLWNSDKLFNIVQWTKRIDNWAHSDGLSSFYAFALEKNPEVMAPILQKWNLSKMAWERRQSVVSLLYYQRLRNNIPDFEWMIAFPHRLLKDADVFVQKGIGWFLRECYQRYPTQTLDYIFQEAPQISATAWQATTEKLDLHTKAILNQIRKENRKTNRQQTRSKS